MLRQVSSRNQRAKGFRLKHALQIGISVAICIWLLYQVKHSNDKKKSYDARNLKLINKVTENEEDFFKFGRKDLQNEAGTVKGIQREEEIEDTQEEEEPEVKQEESEDEEVRRAGGDENAEEAENGEDSAEEEDRDGQFEEKALFESQDHEGGTQEAREENYKRDDVSSAVVHDAHATESGTSNGDARSMDEEQIVDDPKVDSDPTIDGSKVDGAGENLDTGDDSKGGNGTTNSSIDNISDDVVINGTTTDDSPPNNGTVAEGKESEAEVSKADNELMYNSTTVEDANRTELTNSTATTESNNQMEVLANSTGISGNQTEGENNSTVDDTVSLDSTQEQNSTNDEGTLREVETVVDPAGVSNSTAELDSGELSTTSSATEGNGDATTSSATEGNGDSGLGDSDDLSRVAMEEEKENRTDLSTLPTIQNEAKDMDEEAAE